LVSAAIKKKVVWVELTVCKYSESLSRICPRERWSNRSERINNQQVLSPTCGGKKNEGGGKKKRCVPERELFDKETAPVGPI